MGIGTTAAGASVGNRSLSASIISLKEFTNKLNERQVNLPDQPIIEQKLSDLHNPHSLENAAVVTLSEYSSSQTKAALTNLDAEATYTAVRRVKNAPKRSESEHKMQIKLASTLRELAQEEGEARSKAASLERKVSQAQMQSRPKSALSTKAKSHLRFDTNNLEHEIRRQMAKADQADRKQVTVKNAKDAQTNTTNLKMSMVNPEML